MASPPQILSEKDLNLLRNDRIKFEFCPVVYQAIIEWGFEKPDGMKIIDHFNDQKIEEKCGRNLKSWLKKNKKALDATDFSSFDVTTLHDLLPVLCFNKVIQNGTKEWEVKVKDHDSIEYLLNEIKCFRNNVSHEYARAKENPNIEEMQKLLHKCIRTAGALYGKDQSEVDGRIACLDAKFDKLVVETVTYPYAVNHVTKLVEKESATFMLEKYSELFSVPLPGGLGQIGTTQIFESVNLSVAIEDKDDGKQNKTVFSCNEICNHIKNKFVVINGGPGSGKTTLMKHLYQNILENSVNGSELNYEGVSRFKVPIYLECRTEKKNNLHEFLKERLPISNYSKEFIYEAFKEVQGQVFLIDGYDEVNDKSRELVDEIISFCKDYKASCIVSGRVDAANKFISKMKERKLTYNEMLIEPISKMSDKLSFLKKYADKMGDVDSDKLVKSFEKLNYSVQEVFFCPILLALFISLFLNNRNSLSQLHNELSAYKAIRENFYEEIVKKLEESNVNNPELLAENLLEVFSDHSLRLFSNEKYFFGKEELLSLTKDCLKEIPYNAVDIKKVFSCILTPEISLKSGKVTYAFTHSTIQEYMAVRQVVKNMRECNIDWNSWMRLEDSLLKQFLACLGISTSLSDVHKEVKRYDNIVKLLMLETAEKEEVENYAKTFNAVLRKYFIADGHYTVIPDSLLNLISSSNCDSTIVSIVSNFMRDQGDYWLQYTRHIRPLTELLKKRQTRAVIWFKCSESLTDTDTINLGQLVSVLKESKIRIELNHSYDNYQPLNEEFYKQLNNSQCKVTGFRACVTSTDHLSIVMSFSKGYPLHISTVSTCDVNFAILEGHGGKLNLRVKYTDECPTTGSNPVPENTTSLFITHIPADGKNSVYRIINYLSPKSNKFWSIEMVNCHLTDTDANELLKKLEGEIITSNIWPARLKERRVNEDKSRDFQLYLPDFEEARRKFTERSTTRQIAVSLLGEEIADPKCNVM